MPQASRVVTNLGVIEPDLLNHSDVTTVTVHAVRVEGGIELRRAAGVQAIPTSGAFGFFSGCRFRTFHPPARRAGTAGQRKTRRASLLGRQGRLAQGPPRAHSTVLEYKTEHESINHSLSTHL